MSLKRICQRTPKSRRVRRSIHFWHLARRQYQDVTDAPTLTTPTLPRHHCPGKRTATPLPRAPDAHAAAGPAPTARARDMRFVSVAQRGLARRTRTFDACRSGLRVTTHAWMHGRRATRRQRPAVPRVARSGPSVSRVGVFSVCGCLIRGQCPWCKSLTLH